MRSWAWRRESQKSSSKLRAHRRVGTRVPSMARPRRHSTPSKPAPVSGPGAASRRTDGGPGSSTQPIRVPTGGAYGEAKALEAQQRGAPLAAEPTGSTVPSTPPAGAGGSPSSTPVLPAMGGGVFGPSERPSEPITQGIPRQAQGMKPDADAMLRELYRQFPHPQILALIRRG